MDDLPNSGLNITRNIGESVIIETSEGALEVEVAFKSGKQTLLRFKGPRSIRIYRSEVYADRKRRDYYDKKTT